MGRGRGLAGVMAVVALATACGSSGDGDGDDEEGDDPSSTTTEATTTTTAPEPELDRQAAGDLLDRVAATGTLAGHRQRSTDDEMKDHNVCDRPLDFADERLVTSRRSFTSEAASPDPAFAEISQSTTIMRTSPAAATLLEGEFDALEQCERTDDDTYGLQVTEQYAAETIPEGVELDARAITAVMRMPDDGLEFHHVYGCVVREQVVQCISVWAIDPDLGDTKFNEAFVATAQALADAEL